MDNQIPIATASSRLADELCRRVDSLSRRDPGLLPLDGVRGWTLFTLALVGLLTVSLAAL